MAAPVRSSYLQQRLAEKRAELASINEIRALTGTLTDQLEVLEEKLGSMAEGTHSVAHILSSWQNVVKSISLASLGLLKYSRKDYEAGKPLPESLVRIPLNKDEKESDVGEGDEEYEEEYEA